MKFEEDELSFKIMHVMYLIQLRRGFEVMLRHNRE